MASRTALLSVRPRFAEALLDGSKTVEIRRRHAHLADDSIALLYASGPVCALVGAIRVRTTESGTSDELWARWGDRTSLVREEFDAYVDGSERPCAIIVDAYKRFPTPVPLADLRRRQDAFVTPQSYRFLPDAELSALVNGHASQLATLDLGRSRARRTCSQPR